MCNLSVILIYIGDGPACHQKGGHFPCWFCNAKATGWSDLVYMLNANITPLEAKNQDVLRTSGSRAAARDQKTNYYAEMESDDLIKELLERQV